MKEKHCCVVFLRGVSCLSTTSKTCLGKCFVDIQPFLERKTHCTPTPKPPNCEAWWKHHSLALLWCLRAWTLPLLQSFKEQKFQNRISAFYKSMFGQQFMIQALKMLGDVARQWLEEIKICLKTKMSKLELTLEACIITECEYHKLNLTSGWTICFK